MYFGCLSAYGRSGVEPQRITTAHSPTRSVADGWLTSPTYSLSRVAFAPLAHSRQRNQQRFLLAPDTYAVRVTGDFKAAPGLTTARNGLSAFGGFARLRLTHLPLSGESPTIYQQEARLGIFLAVVACPEQAANRASSWSRRQESNPRQADYRSAVLPLNYTGYGAGGRNRTPIPGLEGRCSTIELHPPRTHQPDSF